MIDVYHKHPLSLGELNDATEYNTAPGWDIWDASRIQSAGLNVVAERCATEKVFELWMSSHSHIGRGRRARHTVVAFPETRTYIFSTSREIDVVREGRNSNADSSEESSSGSSSHIDETQITPVHWIPVPKLPIDIKTYVFDAVDVTEVGKQEAEEKHSPDAKIGGRA
jgi:hypothetical protein